MYEKAIAFYHGSPGLCSDFDKVSNILSNISQVDVHRSGYPAPSFFGRTNQVHQEGDGQISDQKQILVGYSWGSIPCLRDAYLMQKNTLAIVLISPFLNPYGTVKRWQRLLCKTWAGRKIIEGKANSIVEQFLDKNSCNGPYSKEYMELGKILANPDILIPSILEKYEKTPSINDITSQIKDIPLLVLWGNKDDIGDLPQAIRFLEDRFTSVLKRELRGAGHTLLWTHAKDIASIIEEFIDKIEY